MSWCKHVKLLKARYGSCLDERITKMVLGYRTTHHKQEERIVEIVAPFPKSRTIT